MRPLAERIKEMNDRYELESNDVPTCLGFTRLDAFRSILVEECSELNDIRRFIRHEPPIDSLTDLADFLADIVVYCFSEARRWGIPLDEVIQIVMDSNESKLDVDGKPIKDERGKFLKGPNYWRPEPKIRALLESKQ